MIESNMLFYILVTLVFALTYIQIRNILVWSYRQQVLFKEGIHEYAKLPSYYVMMFKFWVWPLSSFKNKTEE